MKFHHYKKFTIGTGDTMFFFHQMLASNEIGGAGLIALQLANFFSIHSSKSYVWIPGDGKAYGKACDLGLKCHLYNTTGILNHSKTKQLVVNFQTGIRLRYYSPGIIHIHSPLYYRMLGLGVKFSRLKSIVHVQIEEEVTGLRWAFKNPPDLIITCAKFLVEHVRRALPERYQMRQQIVAVPNAVDTDRFFPGEKSAAKRRIGAPPSTPLVLMLANLAPHKGQETAIRATAMLKNTGVDIELWLAGVERGGGDSYTTHLRSLARELEVDDRTRFLGHRDDAQELLRAAEISLLPSTLEGLPLSILEAQATKVLVLAAPSSGIPEVVIDGKTGFLIPADDVRGYAHRIKSILDTPNLYHQIVEHAYSEIARNYTFQAYCEKISRLYEGLLNPNMSLLG